MNGPLPVDLFHGPCFNLLMLPVDLIFHCIIRLSDGGCGEGVGLANVRAGLKVLTVNLINGLGSGVNSIKHAQLVKWQKV